MFKVEKAIERLEECYKNSNKNEGANFFTIREILLAGHSEEVEDRWIRINNHVADMNERLSRLEEAVKLIQFDNDIEPEKPVTEEIDLMDCTDEASPESDNCDKPSKPSEFISIPRDVAEEWIKYVEAVTITDHINTMQSRQRLTDAIKQSLAKKGSV